MHIFGIPIDNLSREELRKQIRTMFSEARYHRIATLNPEFLFLSQSNPPFHQALLSADLRIADGVGLHFPFWLAGERLLARHTGADMLLEILAFCEEEGKSVALLLRSDGLSSPDEIQHELRKKCPRLTISPVLTEASVVFSNFGAPLQEIYLAQIRTNPGTLRLGMGIGGAFDYMTGKLTRVPHWMRAIGFEWLWRFSQQPSRLKRIWNAVFVFPWRVLTQK